MPAGGPRVLLIRPDHVGDLLLTSPAIEIVRAALPDAHLTLMVGPWTADVARRDPLVDEVVECQFPGFTRASAGSILAPYRLLWSVADTVRAGRFDAALVLRHDHWWGAWLAALAGIAVRVGHAVPECRPFLTHGVPPVSGEHWVRRSLRVAEALLDGWGLYGAGASEGAQLRFALGDRDDVEAARLLAGAGDGGRLIAFHPGSGAALKLWPVGRWIELGGALSRGGARLVLTGSEAEAEMCERIATGVSGAVSLAGRTDLGVLGAVFKACDLVVGVDSGPLHLAVAMDSPSVCLFGPTDPAVYGPWGDPARHAVVRSGAAAAPCGRLDLLPRDGESPACMRAITVEQVARVCHRLLAGSGSGTASPLPDREAPGGTNGKEVLT